MRIVLKVIIVLLLAVAAGVYFYSQRPEFGRTSTGKRMERILQSPHYYKGRFWAITPVEKAVETSQFEATMRFLFGGAPERCCPVTGENLPWPVIPGMNPTSGWRRKAETNPTSC